MTEPLASQEAGGGEQGHREPRSSARPPSSLPPLPLLVDLTEFGPETSIVLSRPSCLSIRSA
jgi:hypothetical protein